MNPLVSIVLPTFNGSRYIEQAIESCINQTYKNWELIIVNDASTDDTATKISKYVQRDKRIRCITHVENRKLPAALNMGFKNSKGQLYTWTSDDNYFHPSALDVMVDYLVRNKEVDIVYTDYTIIDSHGNFIKNINVKDAQLLKYRNCIGACFLYHSYVDKKLNGYDGSMFLIEDYDFWCRASNRFIMKPLHQNLYSYRWHNKSLTELHNEKIFLLTRQAMLKSKLHKVPSNKIAGNRPIYIWGTGNGGKFTLNWIKSRNIRVEAFIDSNSGQWGTTFLDLMVVAPKSLSKANYDGEKPFVIIGSSYGDEIEVTLKELGYVEGDDYTANFLFLDGGSIWR